MRVRCPLCGELEFVKRGEEWLERKKKPPFHILRGGKVLCPKKLFGRS